MNLSTTIILLIIVGFCVMSIRYLMKHGHCDSCPSSGSCHNSGGCHGTGKVCNCSKEKSDLIDEIIKKHEI